MLIFSPDGKSFATCASEGGPIIWDVTSHEKRITCQSAARLRALSGLSPRW